MTQRPQRTPWIRVESIVITTDPGLEINQIPTPTSHQIKLTALHKKASLRSAVKFQLATIWGNASGS